MVEVPRIEVREITEEDIDLIADYWLKSDPDFLISMGVDLNKLPSREHLSEILATQIKLPDPKKASLALIAQIKGIAGGHCNVNNIVFGKEATMHLHLWQSKNRMKGHGTQMVCRSLPIFFERLKLETIWCEPYAINPAPNRTLDRIGFEFVKKYVTIPGSLNFEQEVNRYKLTKVRLEKIKINFT